MTFLTILLVLVNLALLAASVMYFAPTGVCTGRERCRCAAEDARKSVSLFKAIHQALSAHAKSLDHVDKQATSTRSERLGQCVADLRRSNQQTSDSIDDKNRQLAEILDQYGALYRSERDQLESYTQQVHELDRMLAEFEQEAEDGNRAVLRFIREMVKENRHLQDEVSSCQVQVSELISRSARFERDARTDSLTLLPNRRAWDERLVELEKRYPLSVGLVDIDRFKQINDSYGHQAGDGILNLIGTILRNFEAVTAHRIGGDEFSLILPSGAEQATVDEIRDRVRHSKLQYDGQKLSVSVSVGVASRKPNEPIDALINRADESLYAAKAEHCKRAIDPAPPTEPQAASRGSYRTPM